MPIETSTAAGGALIKYLGGAAIAGAVANALAFMFLWPRTVREAFVRIASTITTSAFFGPLAVFAVRSSWPGLFLAGGDVALQLGYDPVLGLLFVAAPIMALAGVPAWWIIGAVVRWLEKRKDKDIGELAKDAAGIAKDIRSAL